MSKVSFTVYRPHKCNLWSMQSRYGSLLYWPWHTHKRICVPTYSMWVYAQIHRVHTRITGTSVSGCYRNISSSQLIRNLFDDEVALCMCAVSTRVCQGWCHLVFLRNNRGREFAKGHAINDVNRHLTLRYFISNIHAPLRIFNVFWQTWKQLLRRVYVVTM